MFKRFTQWLKNTFTRSDYLASSTDIAQLEDRMRRVEREQYGLFR